MGQHRLCGEGEKVETGVGEGEGEEGTGVGKGDGGGARTPDKSIHSNRNPWQDFFFY